MTDSIKKLLRFCVKDSKDYVDQARIIFTSGLSVEHFQEYSSTFRKFKRTPYSLIWQISYDYYECYGSTITYSILIEELKNEATKQIEVAEYLAAADEIFDTDIDISELDYVVDAVNQEYKKSIIAKLAIDAVELSESDPDAAAEAAHQGFTNLIYLVNKGDMRKIKSATELIKEMLDKYKQSGRTIMPTSQYGFSRMDARLGGLFPGELTLFAMPPSTGKSFIAQQLVYHNCLFNDLNGVYATNEITVDQFWVRLCSSQTGIPLNKFLQNSLTNSEKDIFIDAMEALAKEGRDNLLILGPEDCSSVKDLRNNLQAYFGKQHIHLTVVDHINNFFKTASSEAESILNNARELKLLAGYMHTPVVSPTHLNRTGNTSTDFNMNSVQYNALNQIADNIFIGREDPSDPIIPPADDEDFGKPGTLRLELSRSRTGQIGSAFYLKADFSIASVSESKPFQSAGPGVFTTSDDLYGDIDDD